MLIVFVYLDLAFIIFYLNIVSCLTLVVIRLLQRFIFFYFKNNIWSSSYVCCKTLMQTEILHFKKKN